MYSDVIRCVLRDAGDTAVAAPETRSAAQQRVLKRIRKETKEKRTKKKQKKQAVTTLTVAEARQMLAAMAAAGPAPDAAPD